jgi:hypothetical protein
MLPLDLAARFQAAARSHRLQEVLGHEPRRPGWAGLVVTGVICLGPVLALWAWLAIDPHGTPDPRGLALAAAVFTAIAAPTFGLAYRWWHAQRTSTTERTIVFVQDAWTLSIPLGSSSFQLGRIHARDATGALRSWWTTRELASKARRRGMFCAYARAGKLVALVGLEP